VAAEYRFYYSVELTIFSGLLVAGSQIKVGRLIGGRLIEVRLYFDFLALLLRCWVTAPVSVSHKLNRPFAFKIHAKISVLLLLAIFKHKG